MLRELSLFSGIGGFSLGLERAVLATPVAFVEIDPFCQRVLAKHWPGVPIHGDVTTREFIEGEADVITGGFPCQDVSLARNGEGLDGARSGLYRELIRAIRDVRPKLAIVENSPGLLSRGLGRFLRDLASIGYDAEWHCIPACAVGAPHERDRIWIVAYPACIGHETNPGENWGASAACILSDIDLSRCEEQRSPISAFEEYASAECGSQWASEPDICRVVYGLSGRVDRLKALGNSVVPQVVEVIAAALARRQSENAG